MNKLKQKLRNAVAEDTSLAVPFLRIAINDGVGFSLDVRALLLDLHYSVIEWLLVCHFVSACRVIGGLRLRFHLGNICPHQSLMKPLLIAP